MAAILRITRASKVPVVVVIVSLLVTAVALLERWSFGDPTCGSPPTQTEQIQQEAFVKAQLPDARAFEWTVMDCDENGQVVLNVTTRGAGTAASKAFLQDAACRPSTEQDASASDLNCRSGKFDVSVYLEDKAAIDTSAQLTWTPT